VGRDELVGGRADDRPTRRWPGWLGAMVVAGVALAVVRPDVPLFAEGAGGAGRSDVRRDVGDTRGDPLSGSLAGVPWDARGDLVRDQEFVTAALRRMREERPRISRVYFAGTLSDGSRLVLAGSDVNRGVVATSVHSLHVPAGVPLAGVDVVEATALVDPQQVLAWAARGDDGRVRAVVLTRPGRPVRIEISRRVDFDAGSGAPRRRWEPITTEDGAVVTDLGPDVDPIIGVRAEGPGVFTLPLVVRAVPPVPDEPEVAVAGLDDSGYAGPDRSLVSRALREQAGAVVDLRTASARVLWSGAPWKQRRLALVLLTRVDGRRFQALIGQQDGAAFPAGVRALPDSAPDRLPWLLEPFSPQDPTLLLLPTGDGSIIYRRAGQPVRTYQIGPDGVVGLVAPGPSAPSARGADVTVTDTEGRILLRTVLPPVGYDDPLALR
jgi:hypothetical protein